MLAPERFAQEDPHELRRREPFIRYDRSLGDGKQADQYLRAARIVPRELFELNALMAIAMMVDRGLGVSLVPDIVSPMTVALRVARLPLLLPVPRAATLRRGMAASLALRAADQRAAAMCRRSRRGERPAQRLKPERVRGNFLPAYLKSAD